jgi:hypothetical protein
MGIGCCSVYNVSQFACSCTGCDEWVNLIGAEFHHVLIDSILVGGYLFLLPIAVHNMSEPPFKYEKSYKSQLVR